MAPDFGFRGNVNRPFGMPDIDTQSARELFSQLAPLVNTMKNDDLFRQKELMAFEDSIRARQEARNRPVELPTRGPNAVKKQRIVNYAPPTAMQQQFKQEADEARENKFRAGQLQAQNEGRLSAALAEGAQRNAGDMARVTAEINARKEEGAAERTSRETIAKTNREAASEERGAQRDFTAEQNRNKGWQAINIDDPERPGKQIAVRMNLSTGQIEPITHGGQNIGGIMKPGTKPDVRGSQLQDLRGSTQDALDEIKNILGDDDELTSKGKAAVGVSSFMKYLPATEARAGSNSIQRIKSQQILDLIGKMKAQSKTGATGFGNMSNKDLGVLENAATKLDTLTSEAEFKAEMVRIRNLLRKVMQDPTGDSNSNADKVADDLIKKYGG